MQDQVPLKEDEQFAALAEAYLRLRLALPAALQAARADLQCMEEVMFVPAAA
ncbi:MAG TPA: hypothetical protein VGD78_19820 [Chthoniobacterales bacterium]